MREVSEREIIERLHFDNPWWGSREGIDAEYQDMPQRSYLASFFELVKEKSVNRAVILLGPRRVGKTVMVFQTVQNLINEGTDVNRILYLSLETPIYTGLSLSKIVSLFAKIHNHDKSDELFIFFDEIQYLRDWEIHLKSLVDSFKSYKFTATGSAAAALRLKSKESGAGRFTEYLLPPLTFFEFLKFTGREKALIKECDEEVYEGFYTSGDIDALNEAFLDYLNFGGYPEAVFSKVVQADTSRYIKSDIIDKVLLRDLPSLYGINDIQELNRLFTTVAYNSGGEVSLEALAKSSGVAKNTIKRYLEYLEAAYLIRIVHRIDRSAKKFQRATTFKVYLSNPSMRSALFGPIISSDESMGNLTETAIFSQWFHMFNFIENIFYARWKNGEVDIVCCDRPSQQPSWVVEVKWSDRFFEKPAELKSLLAFCQENSQLDSVAVTTLSKAGSKKVESISMKFVPSSLYCYTVGKNAVTDVSTFYSRSSL